MSKIPTMRELMTPMVYTINATASVHEAKHQMATYSIRHLPVVAEGKLIGMVSDRDLKLAQAVSSNDNFDKLPIGDVCLLDVYSVSADETATKVLRHLSRERIGSVLLTENHKLVGIFTVTDACRSFAEYLERSN
jgi:acetoin utilization protein AcuB